jgi:hypothetical protein
MTTNPMTLPALLALACIGPAALAVHESDVILGVNAGRLTSSAVAQGAPGQFIPQRVFTGELTDFAGSWFTNDPGFDSPPGTFAPGQRLTFRIEETLLRLDQSQTPARLVPATDARVRIRFGAQERFTPTTPGTTVEGFAITASSNGQFHRHLGLTLQAAPDAALTPPDAVYALALTWIGTDGPPARSRPVWFVLSKQMPAEALASAVLAAQRLDCPSDIAGPAGAPAPDGELTADDIIAFINAFTASNLATADVAGPSGTPSPDGELTADDIIVFINRFVAGC